MFNLTRDKLYKKLTSSKSNPQTKKDALNLLINKPSTSLGDKKKEKAIKKKMKV